KRKRLIRCSFRKVCYYLSQGIPSTAIPRRHGENLPSCGVLAFSRPLLVHEATLQEVRVLKQVARREEVPPHLLVGGIAEAGGEVGVLQDTRYCRAGSIEVVRVVDEDAVDFVVDLVL